MLNGRLPFNDRDIPTLVEQTKGQLRFSSRVKISAGMNSEYFRARGGGSGWAMLLQDKKII